jgi:pyruvate-formate lyase-activating enzyme
MMSFPRMSPRPSEPPRLVLCDDAGDVIDHPELQAVGVDGPEAAPIGLDEWIPLPEGSDLYLLPGRSPIALDPADGELVVVDDDDLHACSAFLAPAWTRSHLPAYETRPGAPALPLFGYAVLGFADDRLWTTGARVDADVRQDPWTFDLAAVGEGVGRERAAEPANRVLQQLERCALEYHCRAAQNYFLGRHEAPLPTSVACNAQCVGCISLQPDGEFRAAHERLTRRVGPEEIAAVALRHWSRVPDGVVSFGQGCEGEPLLEGEALIESVRLMRRARPESGTVNLNSNASLPDVVARLAEAGLDSMRVSLNSARPDVYAAYYNPRHYGFEDVESSVVEMKRRGRWVSLNLLYFPGVTDTEAEIAALGDFCERTGVDLIQLRNLNVDPEVHVEALPEGTVAPGCGVREFSRRLSERLPRLAYGYFNPTKERYAALAGG